MTIDALHQRVEYFFQSKEKDDISLEVVEQVKSCLKILPEKYVDLIEEENFYSSYNGTFYIEWRLDRYVIHVEVGKYYSTFYSKLPNDVIMTGYIISFEIIPRKLIESLEILFYDKNFTRIH